MKRFVMAVLSLTIGLSLVARGDNDPTNRTIRFPRRLLASSVPGVGVAAQEPIEPVAADATTEAVVGAAEALLADLDAAQAATAQFDFSDDEQRANWSNLPTGIFERKGARMGDLPPGRVVFGQEEYSLSILGTPSTDEP